MVAKLLFTFTVFGVLSAHTKVLSCREVLKIGSPRITADFLFYNLWNLQVDQTGRDPEEFNSGTYGQYFYVGDQLKVRQSYDYPTKIVGRRNARLPLEAILSKRELPAGFKRSNTRAIEVDGIQVAALGESDGYYNLYAKDARRKDSQIYKIASLGFGVREIYSSVLNGQRRIFVLADENGRQTISMYHIPDALPQTQPVYFRSFNLDYPLAAQSALLTLLPYDHFLIVGGSELAILDTSSGHYVALRMDEDYGRNYVIGLRDRGDGTIGVVRNLDQRYGNELLRRPVPEDFKPVEYVIDLTKLPVKPRRY